MEFFRKENEEPAPKFVRRKDDITGDDDDLMRVEMSCGHAADPGSLTGWCRSLLDEGHLKFHCPADVNGGKCGAEWSYPEVRRNASLTETEQRNFEEKLAKFAAKYYHDFKEGFRELVVIHDPGNKWDAKAIHWAKEFFPQGQVVHTTTAVYYEQGGALSPALCEDSMRLWHWSATRREECAKKFSAEQLNTEELSLQQCPNCKSYVERRDLKNLRVVCILCHSLKGEDFEFCWQCLKPWKGDGAPSERCENVGCKNQSLEVLANCKLKDLPGSEIKNCPSIRACPTCGRLIEHMEKCKYIVCPQCHIEFCFACLEIARNCQASKSDAYFQYCEKPLAPKQTQIPVWAQK